MSLSLLVGPANAGKVAALLDRYVAALDRNPVLVVPNGADVERVERDLLRRTAALLGGSIGTFDDLFARIAVAGGKRNGAARRRLIQPAERSLLLARVVENASLNGLSRSSRFPGFREALGDAIADLESALVEPEDLLRRSRPPAAGSDDGVLASLYAGYREELDRRGLTDRELERGLAARLVANDLSAWDDAPVFAYGFEDLTGAQWMLLEALAGRTEVTVSLPYEPGRPAFAALERTANDLARIAGPEIEELPAQEWYDAPALAHLERTLFQDAGAATVPVARHPDARRGSLGGPVDATAPCDHDGRPPPLDGAVRFLEAAGSRAALELVAEEILGLVRAGMAAEEIALVCPGVERWRVPLETAFGSLGIPYALEGSVPLARTAFGHALLGLLRFAWFAGSRKDLFSFLRSPFSGLPRSRADFVEGRLRGRAVSSPQRVEEESVRLLGHPLPLVPGLRPAEDPIAAVRSAAAAMARSAYGLDSPPVSEEARLDLRAADAVAKLLSELEEWRAADGEVTREDVVRALDGAPVRLGAPGRGRVAVLDLLRVRTRRFAAVFILGLEEGVFPARATESPFLPDPKRRELDDAGHGRRLSRPDSIALQRYLFYTACTRAWQRLTLVREAATDDGRPREASPFYDEVRSRFATDDVARWTRRRPLSALVSDLDRASTERERLRAAALMAAADEQEARALARANGWERRLERALGAFSRPTRLTHPAVLRELAETKRFSVTELETFGDCSSMWLFERVVDPKEIDRELDVRLRGSIAHHALYRFYAGLPKRLGSERVELDRLDEALVYLGECITEAVAGQVRLELADVELFELEGTLTRDLEHFVRQEVELGLPLVPRRLEVLFGTPGAPVELQRGLDLGGFTVSGKIDRVDVDPFSARGIVQDYKSGATAHSAAQIDSERRLQIPLYILALRDLVGIEPLGGLYRALAGTREARGLVRASAREDVPGLKRADYLDDAAFWEQVETAKERARAAVERIRAGDVRHDPRKGECPAWCDLWSMCRVRRA